MGKNFIRWLARWLDPEIARTEARLDRIVSQLCYERHWLTPEFPDARDTMQRILESDRAYNRRPHEAPEIPTLPTDISEFREHLRRRAAKAGGPNG